MPTRSAASYFRRLLIVFLAALALALASLALGLPYLFPNPAALPDFGTVPPPPTLLAPRGPLPAGHAGLTEWARRRGGGYAVVGSGFLLALPSGEVIGVTTAHSLGDAGQPGTTLERMAFTLPGRSDFAAEAQRFHGPPGRPRTGLDLTVDYVLLSPEAPPDPALVLTPDPRGEPTPGETVSLSSGLGGEAGAPRWLAGTVLQVEARGAWLIMQETFNPYGLSGSPVFSQHTGQVVGMAIATAERDGRLYIGLHPVGNLVRLAQAADDFPLIASGGQVTP